MTHDELVEVLLRLGAKTDKPESAALYLALRAVVELAKPDDSDDVYPENKVWKSIIIQAIEKELQ
jgi:hypothetical protein